MVYSKDFCYLLGLFAGDGWFQSRGISIGTKYLQRSVEIAELMQRVFNKKPIVKKRKYSDGHEMYLISIYSVKIEAELRKLLHCQGRNKSKTFVIPNFSNKKFFRAFTKGLFDAEAYSYLWRNKPRIAFEIYNEKAITKIVKVLKADKIACSLSRCSDGGFRIDITGALNVNRFNFLYS